MKRMACVISLAAGTGLLLGGAMSPAMAEPLPVRISGLQIALATPGTLTTSDTASLDVTFKGGNIKAIELHLDGQVIKRQVLRTREGRGVITFTLDGLPEGTHDVFIKATDVDGSTATASARIKVQPEDALGLARFTFPKANEMVQGTVPIQIKVDPSVRNPYVTFLIDGDFLAFMNYAPFTYNWDSSKLTNGSHTLNVEVYDGETLAKIKTLTMKVNVNNPGGFTKIKPDVKDLNAGKPEKSTHPILEKIRTAAETVQPDTNIKPVEGFAGLSHIGRDIAGSFEMRNGSAPRLGFRDNSRTVLAIQPKYVLPNPIAPDIKPFDVAKNIPSVNPLNGFETPRSANNGLARSAFANPDGRPIPPMHNVQPSLNVVRPGALALLTNPKDLSALDSMSEGGNRLAHQPLRPRRSGNMAARPRMGLFAPTAPIAPMPVTRVVPAVAKSKKVVVTHIGLRRVRKGAFSVNFDNTPVDFDVPTRVEKGIPFAPFRQIFEHTGGIVQWYEQSQTVRAINSTTEIKFRIGSKSATVNSQPVKLEKKPYVEDGRAIVPLSFVKDALNVNVNFDPANGHLLIESKK